MDDAVGLLGARGVHVERRSSVYETEPVGGPPGQPPYLNQVIEVAFDGSLRALLAAAQEVEAALGRDRSREQRWGPRRIDVDILVADAVAEEPGLIVPHPRLGERRFVLEPLAELAPGLEVPGMGCVRDVLEGLPAVPRVRRLEST